METLFVISAFLLLLQSIGALVAALRFARYVREHHSLRQSRQQSKAALVIPCKGLEPGLEENVRAFLTQDYRDYETIFVTESETDPAYALLTRLIKQARRSAWLVVAGEAQGSGQKIHNLCAALDTLDAIDRRVETLVFADSDARPAKNWLGELTAPLSGKTADKGIGATTGFRWYLPAQGGFWSLLLSAWNASALSLLGERSGFAWGGATAVARANFDRLAIKQRWQGAVSDDYVLTAAIKGAAQRVKFVPACLTASHADASFGELLEFTTRQLRITRVYAPQVWRLTCASHCLFNFAFWGGGLWLLASGGFNTLLALLLLLSYALGAVTGWLRAGVAAQLLTAHSEQIRRDQWAYAALGPLVSLVFLYNLAASLWERRIVWRGIGYDLVSPHETLIWQRSAAVEKAESPTRARPKRKASVRSSKGWS